MTLTMPPRWFSQRLHPDEDMPQTSTLNHPPTQILSIIAEGSEHPTFGDILEVEVLHSANNTSTTVVWSSQNIGGTSSTQTNGGTPNQSPLRAPLLIQVIQENAELEQIQVEDWEDEAYEDEVAEKEELTWVQ
jgi:hypothetical protein